MLKSIYVEDIFLEFGILVELRKIAVQSQDLSPIQNFTEKISFKEAITQNQANFILKILEKYKNLAKAAGLDYADHMSDVVWKNKFRVLDLSKKIYVTKDSKGIPIVCLKFPFQLKKQFDEEVDIGFSGGRNSSYWDPEEKVRKLSLYDYNLIHLYEFAQKHNFDIDESFMSAVADVEEIWQNSENVIPRSTLIGPGIALINASEDAENYFNIKKTGHTINDGFLAKSMGYPLSWSTDFPMGKIIASSENSFWIKQNSQFFEIYKELEGKICIILDRSSNTLAWLQKFVADADRSCVSRDDIKVCFRDPKENTSGLNEWVKVAGVGGKVESGRILIFESKPAKWLFKSLEDVKMLVTNNIYPPTNTMAKEWFQSHPCVIYLGDIKPSEQRGQKIVEL